MLIMTNGSQQQPSIKPCKIVRSFVWITNTFHTQRAFCIVLYIYVHIHTISTLVYSFSIPRETFLHTPSICTFTFSTTSSIILMYHIFYCPSCISWLDFRSAKKLMHVMLTCFLIHPSWHVLFNWGRFRMYSDLSSNNGNFLYRFDQFKVKIFLLFKCDTFWLEKLTHVKLKVIIYS